MARRARTLRHVGPGPLRALAALAGLALLLVSCGRSIAPLSGDARRPSVLAPYALTPDSLGVKRASVSAIDTTRAIARLRPNVSPSDFADSYQAVAMGYIPELRTVLLRAPVNASASAFVARLAVDGRVEFAELDLPVRATETRQASIAFSEGLRPWSDVTGQDALRRIGAPEAQAFARGSGVLVAILDTGIELDHPVLADALDLPGVEPGVTTNPGDDRAEGVDTNGDGLVDGALGHGTHVAGIVHAVAPEARLLAVRVLDSDGVGDAFALARGLVLATERGAAVANMSLGMTGVSLAVESAIDFARQAGMCLAAPSGNLSLDTVDFPAADPPVIAVAATDSLDRRAAFSNAGADVDLAAPGVDILSTYVGGGMAAWSGTAMSTPFVSGVGALLYGMIGPRDPLLEPRVESALRSGAQSLAAADPADVADLGAGRVSASGSVSLLLGVTAGGDAGSEPGLRRSGP
jgi:thermitase